MAPHPQHLDRPEAQVRRRARRGMGRGTPQGLRSLRRGLPHIRRQGRRGAPDRHGEHARRARIQRAARPVLRTLRRPARGPARPVGEPALRARPQARDRGRPRRAHRRPRRRRRQRPGHDVPRGPARLEAGHRRNRRRHPPHRHARRRRRMRLRQPAAVRRAERRHTPQGLRRLRHLRHRHAGARPPGDHLRHPRPRVHRGHPPRPGSGPALRPLGRARTQSQQRARARPRAALGRRPPRHHPGLLRRRAPARGLRARRVEATRL